MANALFSAEARAKGYEGDPCSECQHYTLVRNGTCMKCDTCGSTTGVRHIGVADLLDSMLGRPLAALSYAFQASSVVTTFGCGSIGQLVGG